ncbi:MAG: VOC family protein [Rhodospirillaceae bacterium]|jgi:catechol 2,3-dioxygenase-like lactoylglutathione lyase family enzyme
MESIKANNMKIRHIALRVDDIDAATEFYQNFFDFAFMTEYPVRDMFARHVTDGNVDLALLQYNEGANSNEALAAGEKPCIHHMGFEVEDFDAGTKDIYGGGFDIVSDPGVMPLKFRAPGSGVVTEIVPKGRFIDRIDEALEKHKPEKLISHLAIKVSDLDEATKFYIDTLGFKNMGKEGDVRDHFSRHLTDGTIDLALIAYNKGSTSSEALAAGEKPCIHHMGVEVEDIEAKHEELKKRGIKIISDPGVIPIKFQAPGGGICEIVPMGRFTEAVKEAVH